MWKLLHVSLLNLVSVFAFVSCDSDSNNVDPSPSTQRRIAVNAELDIELAYDGYHDDYTRTQNTLIDTEYTSVDTIRESWKMPNNHMSTCGTLTGPLVVSFCYDTAYYSRYNQAYDSYDWKLTIGCALDTTMKICLKAFVHYRMGSGYHHGGNGGDDGGTNISLHFELENIPYEETSDAIILDIRTMYITNAIKQLEGSTSYYYNGGYINSSNSYNHKKGILSIKETQPTTAHIYLKLTK